MIGFGTAQTVGVYNIEFLRAFDAGAAAVSLVGSINLGVFLGAGNKVCLDLEKINCKVALNEDSNSYKDC